MHRERLARLAPIGPFLVIATVLRLIGLGANGFWFDEALEVARDRLPWPHIVLRSRGPDRPLYRLLQSPLASWTTSELVLRLPSALYSVATVALVWSWIVRLGDRRLALLTAAFVVACCTYYGLLFLIGAIDLVLLHQLWRRRDAAAAKEFVIANALIGAGAYAALLQATGDRSSVAASATEHAPLPAWCT